MNLQDIYTRLDYLHNMQLKRTNRYALIAISKDMDELIYSLLTRETIIEHAIDQQERVVMYKSFMRSELDRA